MRINSFVTPDTLKADTVALSPEESHHLARVLRVEPGQELTLFDGQGTRAEGTVEAVTKKEVTVCITKRDLVPPPEVEITLIQAVCKPDRFEMILQKATELGVRNIQPVVTENASLPSGKIEKMISRGEAIIRNAAQQCGTAWLPDFWALKKLPAVFPMLGKTDAAFIGSLHPNARPFKESFQGLENVKTAALLIGPEGDFTEEEINAAVEAGAIPVTFGKQILRTETAAIFGLSVLSYELC
ncbi:RsmE family RNA methyltransferase [Tichowtungia aerotolerans]|uniref:Ribosomal RNA small subunit methyltransferase E n=1 Tax=Tichowtungia aerotolerans TaxID=2697043 RepID=A0A6P1M6S0_9BACT|nr:RsmE family RNA methyltransferase [Tichowtungia aerotolerans]QHI69551.1 RsmE family RNA methyltransferase [Tichowtungia aerotolerans]